MKLPAVRAEGQIAGEASIDGVIRLPQQKTWFQPDNEPQKNIWFYIDPAEMAASGPGFRTDLYLDAGGTQSRRLSNRRPDPIIVPNDHLQYAVTWPCWLAGAGCHIRDLSPQSPPRAEVLMTVYHQLESASAAGRRQKEASGVLFWDMSR